MAKKPQVQQTETPPFEDEFVGVGGSYIVDPVTGKRRLVERTRPAEEQVRADAGAFDATETQEG